MNRIKELREHHGLEQKQLAADIGVSQPTVSDWENGRKVPSAKSTRKIADYFDVSIDYLLGRTGIKKDSPFDEAELSKIEFALWGEVRELDDEDKAELLRDAQRMRELKELRERQRRGEQ